MRVVDEASGLSVWMATLHYFITLLRPEAKVAARLRFYNDV